MKDKKNLNNVSKNIHSINSDSINEESDQLIVLDHHKENSIFDTILKALSSKNVWLIAFVVLLLNFIWGMLKTHLQDWIDIQVISGNIKNTFLYLILELLTYLPGVLISLLGTFLISYEIYRTEYKPALVDSIIYFKKNYGKILTTLTLYSCIIFLTALLIGIIYILIFAGGVYTGVHLNTGLNMELGVIGLLVIPTIILLGYLACRIIIFNYEIIDKNLFGLKVLSKTRASTNGYVGRIIINLLIISIISIILILILSPILGILNKIGGTFGITLYSSVVEAIFSIITAATTFYCFYGIKTGNKKF